ncbi:sulfotransferase family 2 domain-containing protein [Sinimarinibacterium flocculans]|uniref:Sulfotransferase family protein n=1 Tax=Sinimarinibacterium flocculans TaxID=985250 RepID=A0A318EDQ2_9GAMM|nr:sulfotransferase family 2 domain-containing protein [Sinimarinibacterium flocculans]PXV69764.1 sulfotransferase family protein [Sinimarinibacterium flocculans]
MRAYDRAEPLIAIHVPKAGGITARAVFERWFGDGFLRHYYDEREGCLPERHDLRALHSVSRPVVVYGHFNRARSFGVQDYYPDVRQFVTILRDPFEMAVSRYFYVRKAGGSWRDQGRVPLQPLQDYLRTFSSPMLNHFPRVVTLENYRNVIEEDFIEVGLTEHLDESLARIALALGKPYNQHSKLEYLNATPRDQVVPDGLREEFIARHPLEFAVYDYARQRFMGR